MSGGNDRRIDSSIDTSIASSIASSIDTVVLDIDGTLVDSNYQHTLAWTRAFAAYDFTVPAWRIHRAIGMGGDRLVPRLIGEAEDDRIGDDVRGRWKEEVDAILDEITLLPHAADFLEDMGRRDLRVVLASSGKPEHVEHSLELLRKQVDVDAVIDELSSSGDAASKPAPDLIDKAVDDAGGSNGLVIGDSVWDAEAARRASMPMVGVLTGGFGEAELTDAGAAVVFENLGSLLEAFDEVVGTV